LDNENDARLSTQYDSQIRQVQNVFTITEAILNSEISNAELLVSNKEDMNAAEDIAEANERIAALRLLVDDAVGTNAAEIATLEDKVGTLNGRRNDLA
jgi:hypothetical protein